MTISEFILSAFLFVLLFFVILHLVRWFNFIGEFTGNQYSSSPYKKWIWEYKHGYSRWSSRRAKGF